MSDLDYSQEAEIQSLKNRIMELEHEVAAKQKMVATVSHELRTPMGAIISMAELLGENTSDEARKKYADTLKLSANSLLSIVNQLLKDSKARATGQEELLSTFSLADLIKGTMAALEARLKDQPIKVTLNYPADLPEQIIGDSIKLTQVLNNLMDNAVKFTQVGEIALSVSLLETTANSHLLEFTLQDTGLGIEPEARQKIFTPYTQADTTISSEYGGTGLGLSICKELVEQMGGKINCDSNPGLGSVFTFTAKFKIADNLASKNISGHIQRDATELPNILVVDDNKINQMLIATYLEKGDFNFSIVSSGAEAIELLQNQKFHLVLMDVQMPEMDGMEATKHIRALNNEMAQIPIAAITANAMGGEKEKYLACGMDDYLAKPVNAESLFNMIWKYTGSPQNAPEQARA